MAAEITGIQSNALELIKQQSDDAPSPKVATDYKSWTSTDITNWIIMIDASKFEKYRNVLQESLTQQQIDGNKIENLDREDLKQYGIINLNDRKKIYKTIQKLIVKTKKHRMKAKNKNIAKTESSTVVIIKEKANSSKNTVCEPISLCQSINRIIKYLNEYQAVEDPQNITKIFNKHNFPFLTNDFNHVLMIHLGDKKSMVTTQNEYELIYNYITSNVKSCNLEKCETFVRNNRNRERENILASNQTINIDKETEYFIETMDTMHCFFMHSYDVGFRMKSDELNKIIQIEENKSNTNEDSMDSFDSDDAEIHKDLIMSKMGKLLKKKRERLQNIRGMERSKNSKFVTNIKEDDETDTDNEQKDELDDDEKQIEEKMDSESYSFGHKYNYWKADETNYVENKYNNLKIELTQNKTQKIDMYQFDIIVSKATNKLDTNYARSIKSNDDILYKNYDIEKGSVITIEHIMAVLFYTDYDELSYNFSSTFRSMKHHETFNECKQRNREYWNWSKLLCESVNVFGTRMDESDIKIYYHGISKLLIFSSFLTVFNSPTSTTAQITVSTIFAKEQGAILELTKHSSSLRYFNCTWLSSYCNEDERLFCCPFNEDFMSQLRFESIRSIAFGENYKLFIHALSSLNCAVDGSEHHKHKVNKRDISIINRLIKHNLKNIQYTNKCPQYINDIFYAFCKTKSQIKLEMKIMKEKYPTMQSLFFDVDNGYLKIKDICNLFKKCREINLNYYYYDEKSPAFNLDQQFFNGLYQELDLYNNSNNNKLRLIKMDYVKYGTHIFDEYKAKIEDKKWKVDAQKYKFISISRISA